MKYKVGDRVVGVGATGGWNIDGLVGTVKHVHSDADITCGVEFDEHIGGHDGYGCFKGKSGHCLFVASRSLRPACANKIVITTDGKTTLARLYDGKRVVKSAEAKCAPSDTFDFATGAKLAFDRLMGNEKAEAPKQEPIKLYCVKDSEVSWVRTSLTKGKIYEFDGHRIEYDDGMSAYFTDFDAWKIGDPNYSAVLVPLVKRPAKAREWVYMVSDDCFGINKKGDVVRCIKEGFLHDPTGLWRGGISATPGEHYYLVLDGYTKEHS